MTRIQIQALTINQLQWFTITQQQELKKEQIAAFTPNQIQAFTPTQIQAVTAAQIWWFTSPQIQTLILTQRQALTPEQIQALTKIQETNSPAYLLKKEMLTINFNPIAINTYHLTNQTINKELQILNTTTLDWKQVTPLKTLPLETSIKINNNSQHSLLS